MLRPCSSSSKQEVMNNKITSQSLKHEIKQWVTPHIQSHTIPTLAPTYSIVATNLHPTPRFLNIHPQCSTKKIESYVTMFWKISKKRVHIDYAYQSSRHNHQYIPNHAQRVKLTPSCLNSWIQTLLYSFLQSNLQHHQVRSTYHTRTIEPSPTQTLLCSSSLCQPRRQMR